MEQQLYRILTLKKIQTNRIMTQGLANRISIMHAFLKLENCTECFEGGVDNNEIKE